VEINNIKDGKQVELSVNQIRVKNLFSDKRGQIFPDDKNLYKLEKFFFSLATMRRTMPPQDLD